MSNVFMKSENRVIHVPEPYGNLGFIHPNFSLLL